MIVDAERMAEIERFIRRYGPGNCWTGTLGTAATFIHELLSERDAMADIPPRNYPDDIPKPLPTGEWHERANHDAEGRGKRTNPKDAIGSDKCPLHLLPTTAKPEVALAFLEGALKYGTANWREAGVRASIYKSAAERHLDKWWEGEDRDQQTQVEHLASAIACLTIVLDAKLAGKLTDDRPIACGVEGRASQAMDDTSERVKHLKRLFSGGPQPHWTRNEAKPRPDYSDAP